ncbi:MAG: hypothetical protein SWK76_11130 [Actinomycetota bacterium]|nr:hypothetical protein [Actinomycetota bacterium]
MSSSGENRLYNLLPAIYRIRDEEKGGPLRSLLGIIDEQIENIHGDIEGLYEDWFIETCADWVIPYIGDMVGNKPLHEIKQLRRTDVAKTIYYRRRKGAAAMLEELARDVTGWGAHVVEFFQLLSWTQNLNHLRYDIAGSHDPASMPYVDRVGTVNLRSMDVLDRLDGPFDIISHNVDIRPIEDCEGWYNIRKIGFFLWRLNYYVLSGAPPRDVAGHPGFYTFSRLGNKAPLFNKPRPEAGETALAGETQVPGPIRPMAFERDLDAYRSETAQNAANSGYYGPGRGVNIEVDGKPVTPQEVVAMDLTGFEHPPSGKVAVDVRSGLLGFAKGEEPSTTDDLDTFSVTHTYGFSADIGGGPYERRQDMIEPVPEALDIDVARDGDIKTIQGALDKWEEEGKPPRVIKFHDNGVYGGNVDISLPDQGWLALQADNGVWPDVRLVGVSSLGVETGVATLILDGFLIEGAFELSGGLHLTLQHCTLVPGRMLRFTGQAMFPDRDSLTVGKACDELTVAVKKCVTGTIRMPADGGCLRVEESVIQPPPQKSGEVEFAIAGNDEGTDPGPPLHIRRSTVLGSVFVRELELASDTLFCGPVKVLRHQEGCVRFCYIPEGSVTPRRYRCQPEMAEKTEGAELKRDLTEGEIAVIKARLEPRFTSMDYGEPGYAQLGHGCAEEIRAGAEDGAEMGAFCSLKQHQREASLNIRLKEYLPFGLEPGFIHTT